MKETPSVSPISGKNEKKKTKKLTCSCKAKSVEPPPSSDGNTKKRKDSLVTQAISNSGVDIVQFQNQQVLSRTRREPQSKKEKVIEKNK